MYAKMLSHPENVSVEEFREQFYGFVFTERYKNHEIPDIFNMDYWDDLNQEYDSPQSELLGKVIESSGDGKTPETAFCVICVGNEYDFMERRYPYCFLDRKKQSLEHCGDKYIDCIEFKENMFGVEKVYFDITAWFENVSH